MLIAKEQQITVLLDLISLDWEIRNMSDENGRPDHIMDYLTTVRTGQWFGFDNLNGDEANKTYANFIVHDGGSKPTEQECTDGLTQLQTDFDNAKTKRETDKANAKAKLIAGEALTEDEANTIVL